ncbi:MAG: hypothetical protein AVDCRST_MAG02-38, partial [uncultured Rubrobacteraceae bacterium]
GQRTGTCVQREEHRRVSRERRTDRRLRRRSGTAAHHHRGEVGTAAHQPDDVPRRCPRPGPGLRVRLRGRRRLPPGMVPQHRRPPGGPRRGDRAGRHDRGRRGAAGPAARAGLRPAGQTIPRLRRLPGQNHAPDTRRRTQRSPRNRGTPASATKGARARPCASRSSARTDRPARSRTRTARSRGDGVLDPWGAGLLAGL